MKNSKWSGRSSILVGLGLLMVLPLARAELDARMSMNVKDTPLKSVLEIMAAKAGLELVLETDPNVNVTLAQGSATVKQLLEKLSSEQQIEYSIVGNKLIVNKRYMALPSSVGDSHLIPIKYASVNDVSAKISNIIGGDERIMVDERTSSLIFVGSRRSFERIMRLVQMIDLPPKQIMIEAQIVETSNMFLRNLGVALGDLSDTRLRNDTPLTGFTTNSGPTSPNISLKAILGRVDGRNLDMRITAAESSGDARVISRPKVMTLNNQQARINSGITYSIKTLSAINAQNVGGIGGGGVGGGAVGGGAVGGVGGGAGGMLAGGVTSVNAGLTLNILPSLVGNDQVRLQVDINNSQPDEGSAIDGIPGILTNSANTSVIVKNRETAVIAGLIKQSKTNSNSGVPILSNIPLIGALFKSDAKSDRNNELVIFITPTVEENKVDREETPAEVAARLPATAPDSPADDTFNPKEE